MVWRMRGRGVLSGVTLAAILTIGLGATGCRTTDADVHRWANTAQGPRKILAVLTHDKYSLDLRVEAAMTLVRMKPRGGRRIGIEALAKALSELPPATRAKIVTPMIPQLEASMKKPPPEAQAGQPPPPDASIPDKDAAFALLTHDGAVLIEDENSQKRLKAALAHWCAADFNRRLEDSSQKYGVEQVLRYLSADGVRQLPDLIVPNAKKIDKLSKLIANLGDDKTKARASANLVKVATQIDSQKWLDQKAPAVEAANKASKLEPTKEQFQAQLEQFQEEELLRAFASMKLVGSKASVSYLLNYAADHKKPEKRRATALAALEGHIDKNDKKQVDTLLDIAEADDEKSPTTVRGQALNRIGELPRGLVVDRLYKLFSKDNWKIRWVAAELVLKMSEAKHLPEFFRKLSAARGMSMSEPLLYGSLLPKLKGGDGLKLAEKYATGAHSVNVRLSALGYFYEHGDKTQLGKVARYENDRAKVPECDEDADDCEWKCNIPKGKESEEKEVETVGDFVKYCIKPAMEKREKAAPKKKEGKGAKK